MKSWQEKKPGTKMMAKRVLVASVIVCWLTGISQAALLSDDFEDDTVGSDPSQPTIVHEPANTTVEVVDANSNPYADPFEESGNQSLVLRDNNGDGDPHVSYKYDPITGDATASLDFYLELNNDQGDDKPDGLIRFRGNGADGPRLSLRDIYADEDPQIQIEGSGIADQTFTTEAVHTLSFDLDVPDNTFSLKLDGDQVTTDSGNNSEFAFDDSGLTQLDGLILYGGNENLHDSQVYYDNILVAVPEPGSMALLGLGGALMMLGRRRDRGPGKA